MALNYNMDKFETPDDWIILFSVSLQQYIKCICGHRVKRITYLYHKPSKTIQYVGKTCVKKYGIYMSMTNTILLDVIKENYSLKTEWDIDLWVRTKIHSLYLGFMTHTHTDTVDYIGVVLPFRRLLTDVCDLVSEYGFDLVDLLTEVERDVESLNYTTRHQMVDEYESLCDTISEIPSDEDISTMDSDTYSEYLDEVLIESNEQSNEQSKIYKWNVISNNGIHILERSTKNDIICQKEVSHCKIQRISDCISNKHCWCEIKYRLHKLKSNILETKTDMNIIHIELQELSKRIELLQIQSARFCI